MSYASFRIAAALSRADLDAARQLFEAYGASLSVDLSYQNFTAERAGLPGAYSGPAGALLLARDADGEPIGCVALRPIAPEGCCEMKRLYVSPRGRGRGLGRALVEAIVAEASRLGYREMRLDSLPTMTEAIALYGTAGFVPTPAYYDTPVAGTVFMGRVLAPEG